AHFAAAFPSPNYLTIGCTNKLQLKSSLAVSNFLPNGTTAGKLPAGTLVNPTRSSYANVLAGQLVAATLSVKFDLIDANFSSSSVHLQDLVYLSGTFAGKTV